MRANIILFSIAFFIILASSCVQADLGSFLWISDIHYDPLFDVRYNSSSFCRSPAAKELFTQHQIDEIKSTESTLSASGLMRGRQHVRQQSNDRVMKFGRYGCNTSPQLLNDTMQHLYESDFGKLDFVLVSGDQVGHGMPSAESALATVSFVSQRLASALGPKVGSNIYPVIGNTDVFPDYYLEIDQTPNKWLAALLDIWKPWISTDEQRASFLRGGYYRVDLGSGSMLIVLNSIIYSFKHWPSTQEEDPLGQFAWFRQQLEEAGKRGIGVIVATHIPPTVESYSRKPQWLPFYQKKYFQLVNVYKSAIRLQLFGHLHKDELRANFNPFTLSTTKAEDLPPAGLITPSISPVFLNNPSFRKVFFERDSGRVTSFEQHYMDLYGSNKDQLQRGRWNVLYDFSKHYNTKQIDQQSVSQVLEDINSDPSLLSSYAAYRRTMFVQDRYVLLCEQADLDYSSFNQCIQEGSNDG